MRGNEVRDQVLFLARLFRELLEHALEAVIGADTRLHHLVQRATLGMLRGNLQVTADVVGDQLLDVLRRLHRQVVTQARGNQDLLHTRQGASLAVQFDQRAVVGVEVFADAREHARRLAAVLLDVMALAGDAVHVGSRAAKVGNHAGEARHLVTHLFDFMQDRLVRAVLDDAAFVLGDRAEGAATEAATHDVHREADHLVGRDAFLAVGRVRHTGIGHAEHVVHFLGAHGDGWRVEPHIHFAMLLHQGAGVARVGLQMQHPVGMGIEYRVVTHLLERRQADHRLFPGHARAVEDLHDLGFVRVLLVALGLLDGTGLGVLSVHVRVDDLVDAARAVDAGRIDLVPALRRVATHESSAAHIGDGLDLLAVGQALGHLDHRAFGVAE